MFPTDDVPEGRTRCLICDTWMWRYEVRKHEWQCAQILEGLDRLVEQAVAEILPEKPKRRRKAYVPEDE